jgi:hypothetical protein
MAYLIEMFGPSSKKMEELKNKVDELRSIHDENLKKQEKSLIHLR